MTDLEPAAAMVKHQRHPYGSCTITVLSEKQSDLNHCEPYRLAEALVAAQEDVARLSAYSAAAFEQRDAALDALAEAASERDAARARAVMLRGIIDGVGEALGVLPYDDCLINYGDQIKQAS